jgi:hypothetical protein
MQKGDSRRQDRADYSPTAQWRTERDAVACLMFVLTDPFSLALLQTSWFQFTR